MVLYNVKVIAIDEEGKEFVVDVFTHANEDKALEDARQINAKEDEYFKYCDPPVFARVEKHDTELWNGTMRREDITVDYVNSLSASEQLRLLRWLEK